MAHCGPKVKLHTCISLKDTQQMGGGLLPKIHLPFIGMHKILLTADFLYLSPQSISLLTVLHQKGSVESSQIGKVVFRTAVIGRHRIRYVKLCIGFGGEVTGATHHSTNPVVDIVQAERASYYLFRRTEQAACQIIGNDSSGNATCQVGCREWTAFQELERIYLEKSRVCQLYHNRKITATVGRLYITVFRQVIMQLGRNDKSILYGIEPVLQRLVGNSPLHGPGIVAISLREF